MMRSLYGRKEACAPGHIVIHSIAVAVRNEVVDQRHAVQFLSSRYRFSC